MTNINIPKFNNFNWQAFIQAIESGKIVKAQVDSDIKGKYNPHDFNENMISITLTLDQVYTGVVKLLKQMIIYPCSCQTKPWLKHKVECANCGGTGRVTTQFDNEKYNIQYQMMCGDCNGTGEKTINNCSQCGGIEYLQKQLQIKLNVPKGVPNNAISSIYQDAHNRILCRILIDQGQDYTVDNIVDINKKLQINIKEAIIGCKKELKYLNDEVVIVQIPQGTSSGSIIIVPNKGLINPMNNKIGDLRVTVTYETPKNSLMTKFNRWLIGRMRF